MSRQLNGLTHPAPTGKVKRLGLAFALASALAALIIVPVAAKLLHIRTNLSVTASVTSGFPAIVINPFDASNPSYGEFVAVAWTDGVNSTSAHQGPVRLKFATESTGVWWEKQVLGASNFSKSKDVALAPDPSASTGNRVHLVWAHTSDGVLFDDIYYAACTLNASSGAATCDTPSDGNAPAAGSTVNLESPDVAVDSSGTAHVVWAKRVSETNIEIWYRQKSGSGWASAGNGFRKLNTSSYKGFQPAIAHSKVGSTEYIHVVWADQTANRLLYARRVNTGSGWGAWDFIETVLFDTSGVIYTNPGLSDIAARGQNVYAVWDVTKKSGASNEFILLYRQSSDSGANWANKRCIPSNTELTGVVTACPTSTDEGRISGFKGDTTEEFDDRLRPRLFLEITNTLTIPHLVWQQMIDLPSGEGTVSRFDVEYTYVSGSNWVSPTAVLSNTKKFSTKALAPMMVVGQNGEKQFVYMEPRSAGANPFWDVIYWGDDIPPHRLRQPIILK